MITIDGKEYDEQKFSPELQNYIAVRQEIQISKIRHNLELENIEVLTKFYNIEVQIKYYRQFNIEKLTDEKNPTKTLETGCKILEDIGIKYWISQGTLLGFYRDKNFIEGDSDIDIEILDLIDADKFQEIVEKLPFDLIRSASLKDKYMQLAFIDPTNNVIFDIWFLYSKRG